MHSHPAAATSPDQRRNRGGNSVKSHGTAQESGQQVKPPPKLSLRKLMVISEFLFHFLPSLKLSLFFVQVLN